MKINITVEVPELELNYPCSFCKFFNKRSVRHKVYSCKLFYKRFTELNILDIQPHQRCLDARKKEV